jgi:bacterial/archaeal transporter family-2 protein
MGWLRQLPRGNGVYACPCRGSARGSPRDADIHRSHWWAWTGGFFGAVYIAVSIFLVPRLGAAFFLALLVAGQMVASIAFDHLGLLGLSKHPIDLSRLIGAVLLVAGVVLIRF